MGLKSFFEWYHDNGIIPNLWKGFTGQLSAEKQTSEALAEQGRQYDAENLWQRQKYAADMDFANRQLDWQMETAQKNFGLQQEQFQYQKDLNNLQMQREDSAMQRQVADLTAAGFSPLAAIGGSGSAAGSLNAGIAPQMDTTGVGTAAGQYLDIARQYASLHQDLASKNMDARLGAKLALSQMKADLHFKGQNMATQYFNAAVNARNKSLQNDSLMEDIQTKKYANRWYEEHGYSQTTLATVLSDFLNRDDVKSARNKFMELISQGLTAVGDGLTAVSDSIKKLSKSTITFSPKENNEMAESLSNDEQSFVLNWCKSNNKSLSDLTLDDWLKIAADEKKSRKGK